MENYALGTLLFHSEVVRILGVVPFGYTEEKFSWFVGLDSRNEVYEVCFYRSENQPVLEIYEAKDFQYFQKSVSRDTLFSLMGLAIHHGVEVDALFSGIEIYFEEIVFRR